MAILKVGATGGIVRWCVVENENKGTVGQSFRTILKKVFEIPTFESTFFDGMMKETCFTGYCEDHGEVLASTCVDQAVGLFTSE